jgi:hypothetical protein
MIKQQREAREEIERIRIETETRIEKERIARIAREKAAAEAREIEVRRVQAEWEYNQKQITITRKLAREAREAEARERAEEQRLARIKIETERSRIE